MSCNKALVILAGGLGSRYKGLKQIDDITGNGSPILEYSIYDAIQAGFKKVVLIINKMIPEDYLQRLRNIATKNKIEILWVYQNITDHLPENFETSPRKKPWGTGHALLCVKDIVTEPFAIVNADDFYGKEIYTKTSKIIDDLNITPSEYRIIAYPLETTVSKNGSVSRGICSVSEEQYLEKIVERTEIFSNADHIYFNENNETVTVDPKTLVSMNFTIFHPSIFEVLESEFHQFLESKPSLKDEFFIPKILQNLIDKGNIKVKVDVSPSQWMGVTYPEDKAILKEFLNAEIAKNRYPTDLWN